MPSMRRQQQQQQQLTDEVTFDILSRLAVKDLLCLRCVSKSWCALIRDPYFVKKHLERSTETNTNLSLILKGLWVYGCIHKVDLNEGFLQYTNSELKLDNDLSFKPQKNGFSVSFDIVGSCNGLICMRDSTYNGHDHEVVIWNPSTNKSHMLPAMPVPTFAKSEIFRLYKSSVYGFGHDRFSDDYKVIVILQIQKSDDFSLLGTRARVYSFKTKSWRKKSWDLLYSHTLSGSRTNNGTFVSASNALHWLMEPKEVDSDNPQPYFVAAFDLGVDNGYHEVQQPDYQSKNVRLHLGVLGGCLCIIISTDYASNDIWVMKDYGVKESWTKLISVPDSFPNLMRPLAYSRGGDKVLLIELDLTQGKLLWYDLQTKTVTFVMSPIKISSTCILEVCIQSLVPVISSKRRNQAH